MNSKSDRNFASAIQRARGGDHLSVLALLALLALAMALVAGCTRPSQANIELRKQIASRDADIARLKLDHDADQATIKALQGSTQIKPAIANDRIEALFTTHGIRLGRLTGFAYTDAKNPGPDGIKVYVTPFDGASDELKAAGALSVEAFDLSSIGHRVGKWDFSTAEARKLWNGQGLLYEYVLPCPFDKDLPLASELTLKVTFVDELTGRSFTQQQVIQRR